VAALLEEGIPASVSQSAGTFVCNHVFFGLAHYLAQTPARDRVQKQAQKRRPRSSSVAGGAVRAAGSPVPPRGGFIHVPWPAGEEGAIGAATSAIDLPAMTNAIRIAIRVTLSTHGADLRLPGGAID
jgi:pyroglutamyl-peptidase